MAIKQIKVENVLHDLYCANPLSIKGNSQELAIYDGSVTKEIDVSLENTNSFIRQETLILDSGNITNQIPISQAVDSTNPYNGIGYKTGTRWSESGKAESATAGHCITGYIPCSYGSVLRFKNITVPCTYPYLVYFDSSKTVIGIFKMANQAVDLFQRTLNDFANVAYIRLVVGEITSNSVITIDQDLASASIGTGWLHEGEECLSPNTLISQVKTTGGTDWINQAAGTGLTLAGTTLNHSNSVTAATAKGSSTKTLAFGGTFTIPTVKYDAQGHITEKGTTTMTMPENPNTHYKSKNIVGGSTTATTDTTSALANGSVYLNSIENNAVTSSHNISGAGATTVKTDASGNIVINTTEHPTSLKNPYSLTIQGNGTTLTNGTYNGSAAKTVNITPSAIGAAKTDHTHLAGDITGGTLPLTCGGTGSSIDLAEAPKNAVIRKSNSDDATSLHYTATANGAFYATSENGRPSFGTLPIAQGGTGLTSNPSMLINLASTSAASVFAASPRPGITGTLPIANGGTGKTTWTEYGIVYGSSTNKLTQLGAGTSGQVLKSNGSAAPSWVNQSALTAGKADKLSTARKIELTGAVTGSGSFDGSGALEIATTKNHAHAGLYLDSDTSLAGMVVSEDTSNNIYYRTKNRNSANTYHLGSNVNGWDTFWLSNGSKNAKFEFTSGQIKITFN